MYKIIFSKQASKDKAMLKRSGLDKKAKAILVSMQEDPFYFPPPYEALRGNLDGLYSRRINIQHRIVYEVFEDIKTVRIIRMWTHYE